MSVLSNIFGNYADDLAKAASKVAANSSDDVARALAKSAGSTIDDAAKAASKTVLTPEQEAFFKNSVMRDSSGNLVPVYHSTPSEFSVFDDSMIGKNTGYENTGFGHFVSTDRDFSKKFRDINNTGVKGTTMDLYANITNPITHPYYAGRKYSGKALDDIVENYFKATDNQELLDTLKEYAKDNGTSIYDEYMDLTLGDVSPFEFAGEEKKLLQGKGYDAIELVEGLKNELVDNSKSNIPVSSYAIFDGSKLKSVSNKKPTINPNIYLGLGGIAGTGLLLNRLLGNKESEA